MPKFNMQDFVARPFGCARLRALIAALTLMVMVAGCSSVRFGYQHGDTLLYWWLNGYVDLESEQKEGVKEDIAHLFDWHRKTQLKDYVHLLETGQSQLQGNVTQADLLADYDAIKSSIALLLLKATPELADLARSLQPEQIANMEKKFAANNDDYRKKFLKGSAEQRQIVRHEKSMAQFTMWFGAFSREQEAIIRKASDARPLDNQRWLDERMLRQKNILALLRKVQREKTSKKATVAQIEALIKDGFARLEQSEYKAFFNAYSAATTHMVIEVITMATPAQKSHAHKRMQGWIDDFNSLAGEAR